MADTDTPWAVILHGVTQADPSPDEADTLLQAEQVRVVLTGLGYRVTVTPIGHDLSMLARLELRKPDVVFNLIEAMHGDGRLAHVPPLVMESLGLAFTGCSAMALMTTTDKLLTKTILAQAGLPTPGWIGMGGETAPDPRARYIVKAVSEDASLGLDPGSVVGGLQVPALIAAKTAEFGGTWFAERYVDGREFNIAVIAGPDGPEVLPIAEMTFVDFPDDRPRIVDYAAKWDDTSHAYHHTPRRFDLADSDAGLVRALRRLALDTWRVFDLRGYARVDVRVDGSGRPLIIEVNGNPCLSADAGFMAAAARAGLGQADVVRRIVRATYGRSAGCDGTPTTPCHPRARHEGHPRARHEADRAVDM